MRLLMKLFFLAITLLFSTTLYATLPIGIVSLCKGNIKLKHKNSIVKKKVQTGTKIQEGDLISSTLKSAAKIKLIDGSVVVLDQSSSIYFKSLSQAEQKSGTILYRITSRDAKNALKIKTPFAIIGIKGTTFIVNATDNASVSLKEGLLGINSLHQEFYLYRKKLEDEFAAFKAQGDKHIKKQKEEFERYKQQQSEYKKVEIVKSFDLKAGNKISFEGRDVKEKSFSKSEDSEFQHFYKLLNTMQ